MFQSIVGKLAAQAKKQEYREVQYRQLETDAFDILEPRLLRAVRQAAYDPTSVPIGQFRRVVEHDPNNGQKMVKFIGQRSFIDDFKAPVRRVISFLTPHGRVNASGMPVR
jgi:hypothetical protein